MKRIDVYRREKPRKRLSQKKPLTTAKVWQAFVGLLLIWSCLAALLWLFGFDFMSERGYRKLTVCGVMRFILPANVGEDISCLWWNLAPFYIMPAAALFIAVKKTITRS